MGDSTSPSYYKMIVTWGQPKAYTTYSTLTLSWDDCLNSCLNTTACVLVSNQTAGKCLMFTLQQITTVSQLNSSSAVVVGFKIRSNETTCSTTENASIVNGNSATGGVIDRSVTTNQTYQPYTISSSGGVWTFTLNEKLYCGIAGYIFDRPRGPWCIWSMYSIGCVPQVNASGFCYTSSSIGFWIGGTRRTECMAPNNKSASCNGSNEFSFVDPTFTSPGYYGWLSGQPSGMATNPTTENCLELKFTSSRTGVDDVAPLDAWCLGVFDNRSGLKRADGLTNCQNNPAFLGGVLSGIQTVEEFNFISEEAKTIASGQTGNTGFWIDGIRKDECKASSEQIPSECDGIYEFNFTDATLEMPGYFPFDVGQPSGILSNSTKENCLYLRILNDSVTIDDWDSSLSDYLQIKLLRFESKYREESVLHLMLRQYKYSYSIHFLVALLTSSDALFNWIGNDQSVTVTGRLICDGQPASDVLVKLYEDGTIYDTKLDSMRTDSDGTFRVSGKYTKIFDMDPKVNIYHSCNYHGLCDKKLTIDIPHYAITSGAAFEGNGYDIGTLNLADQFSGESTDCIH
ncbi:unnamed protein product [Caenorhabditis sp. 36 PRJEB53466]|nr:unnamed protein product [Caenorhabditis sp. 36 PRJEB53466]